MEKTTQFIREEIKFLITIGVIIASVLVNYFALSGVVELNTYRIESIETARAEKWATHDVEAGKNSEKIQQISEDVAIIKEALDLN